jgi:dephospho-CoA kinase
MSEADARARLANQSPQEEKVARADEVIDGSAPLDETRAQVAAAFARLMGWDRATEQEAPPDPVD